MTRLLSEEELKEELGTAMDWYARYLERGQDDLAEHAIDSMMQFVQGQKQAHAEMVIGEKYAEKR